MAFCHRLFYRLRPCQEADRSNSADDDDQQDSPQNELFTACHGFHTLLFLFWDKQASINKGTHVGQPVFSVLFALFSLAGDSPPASKRTKIPRKSKAVRCEAVLPEQKCSQTRKRPQRILCVFSRALTQYEGISARQNRVCPCQSTQVSFLTKQTSATFCRKAPHAFPHQVFAA